MVDSGDNLREELNQDILLRSDVKSVVENISPWIPYLGIPSGGVIVGKRFNRQEQKHQPPKEAASVQEDGENTE